MTPLDLARSLAREDNPKSHALAVAIVYRGVTDEDDNRMPWPTGELTAEYAAKYLDLDPTPDLIAHALTLAPTISEAMLNKGAATR